MSEEPCQCCGGTGYHSGKDECPAEGRITQVYQAVSESVDGMGPTRKKGVYWSYEDARLASDSMDPKVKPLTRHGLVLPEGTVYLFENAEPVELYKSREDFERKVALAKLTPREQALLGLVPK